MHLYLWAPAEQGAYGAICTLHVSSPLPGSRKWSVHEAEGSAQETSIKECLIMGRELLELEAKSSSESPELFAGSRCGVSACCCLHFTTQDSTSQQSVSVDHQDFINEKATDERGPPTGTDQHNWTDQRGRTTV